MKTQERVAFWTDIFQEIQTWMFPPLFHSEKDSQSFYHLSEFSPTRFWRTEKTTVNTEPIFKYTQPPLPGLGKRAETTASVWKENVKTAAK